MNNKPPSQNSEEYACANCFEEINEGEYKTFGVCDKCWDKNYPAKKPELIVTSSGKEELRKKFTEQVIVKKWEEANRFWKNGVNPSAYKIGADAAFDFFWSEIEVRNKELIKRDLKNFYQMESIDNHHEAVKAVLQRNSELQSEITRLQAELKVADEVIHYSGRDHSKYEEALERYQQLKSRI